MNEKIKIVHCGGGYPTNIGNAFIDFGIKHIVDRIFPRNEYFITSNAIDAMFNKYGNSKDCSRFFNIAGLIEADFYILGGSMLSMSWFEDHYEMIRGFRKEKSRLILLGVSGSEKYNDKEKEGVRELLEDLNIAIFISRDKMAYKYYGDLADNSYDGIDCAFFLNDIYNPPLLNIDPFVTFTFDKMKEPTIYTKKKIIRAHHASWKFANNSLASLWDIKLKAYGLTHHQHNIIKHNEMISDMPEDYLTIYSNSSETYSDRIHACVAALSFGNLAKLFTESQRSLLFDRIGLSKISQELVRLDKKTIEKEKADQIRYLENKVMEFI